MSKDNKAVVTASPAISTILPDTVGTNPFPADQELISIGLTKVGNSKDYQVYIIHSKGGKVTKMVFNKQPDIKYSAVENSQLEFCRLFLGE